MQDSKEYDALREIVPSRYEDPEKARPARSGMDVRNVDEDQTGAIFAPKIRNTKGIPTVEKKGNDYENDPVYQQQWERVRGTFSEIAQVKDDTSIEKIQSLLGELESSSKELSSTMRDKLINSGEQKLITQYQDILLKHIKKRNGSK